MKIEEIHSSSIRIDPSSVIDWNFVVQLAICIRLIGLWQPPVLEKKKGFYRCIVGRHRVLACRAAGESLISCIVVEGASAEALKLISVESNRQRKNISETDMNAMDSIALEKMLAALGRGYNHEVDKAKECALAFVRSVRAKGIYKDAIGKSKSVPIRIAEKVQQDSLSAETLANLRMTKYANDTAAKYKLRFFSEVESTMITRIMVMHPEYDMDKAVEVMRFSERYNKINWPPELDHAVSKIRPDMFRLVSVFKKVRTEVLKFKEYISQKPRTMQIMRMISIIDIRLADIAKDVKEKMIPSAICSRCAGSGAMGECEKCMGDGWLSEKDSTEKDEKFRTV